jgi:hypothetical protein
MILATVATAGARIMSDRHWASDTLFGAAVGFGTGYGLPWFLHYRARSNDQRGADDSEGGREENAHVAVVPFGDQRSIGVAMIGAI